MTDDEDTGDGAATGDEYAAPFERIYGALMSGRDKVAVADDTTVGIPNPQIDVFCPHCERREEIDDEFSARAWLIGHILAEHEDALPRLEGTA